MATVNSIRHSRDMRYASTVLGDRPRTLGQ